MEKEIIKDKLGNPISVRIDYKEWLGIEQVLNYHKLTANPPENPLDWYALTESANSILNELIAYTGRERFIEQQKDVPDLDRIRRLQSLSKELKTINRNSDNFKDGERLKNIIEIFGPLIKKVNNGEQLI